jgi:hypothetical protein
MYPSLGYGSPTLIFNLIANVPVWGNQAGKMSNGNPFPDFFVEQFIYNQMKLTGLKMCGGSVVYQLQCTYSSGDAYTYGSDNGAWSQPFELGPAEEFTSISGTCGDEVNQVAMFTNNSGSTPVLLWPPNPEKAAPYSWTIPSESVLAGFQGRAGTKLNQLSPIVCVFSPAQWPPSRPS